MNRTTVFNNAGVCFCQAGHYDVAQDMFLAALEETLLFARAPGGAQDQEDTNSNDENGNSNQGGPPQRVATPPCVITAENHLSNMEAILSSDSSVVSSEEDSSENTPPTAQPNLQEPAATNDENDENGHTSHISGGRPYLYKDSIALQEHSAENSPMQLTGAIVVYNLALVHHLKSASSVKARQFYEIAEALMEDGLQAMSIALNINNDDDVDDVDDGGDAYRCTLLQVGLTNNFGVWSYENGNMQVAGECLQRLMGMMPTVGPILPRQLKDGLQSNIRRQLSFMPSVTKTTPAWA